MGISGTLAPQRQGCPWSRRPLASRRLSPRDSHTQRLEQTGLSCHADGVRSRPHPSSLRLAPNPRLSTLCHGASPVLFGPPLKRDTSPQAPRPRLPHRGHCGGRPTCPGLVHHSCWWRSGASPRHPENGSRRLRQEQRVLQRDGVKAGTLRARSACSGMKSGPASPPAPPQQDGPRTQTRHTMSTDLFPVAPQPALARLRACLILNYFPRV